MYQLISAIAKPLGGDGHWINVEIGNVPMHVLYSTYSRIWAILSNPFLPTNVALDVELIRIDHGGKSTTFNEVLESIGSHALPTTKKIPTIQPRYAKYQDLFRAGYQVSPIHPHYSLDAPVPDADRTWLHITRPELDHQLFYKNCLVNINGFYHLTDASDEAVYVVDGMKSVRLARENQLGFVSFASLGNIKLVPIKTDMIYKQTDEQLFRHTAYVDLKEDLEGKTVMLVLGGYLHAIDNATFSRVGNSSFMIDFANLPFIERYLESKHFIDLSSMNLSTTDRNKNQVSLDELMGDEAITAYLTLSQSFFVILNHNDIFAELEPMEPSVIPNLFVTDEVPIYPMVTGVGRTANYWSKFDHGKYALFTGENLRDRPLHKTMHPTGLRSVTDQRIPSKPVYYANAAFFKIGTDLS